MAKELARYIFGPSLRVTGNGRWSRDSRGQWSVSRFQITEFTQLEDDPLGEVVADLRQMAGTTREPAGALETLRALRRGEEPVIVAFDADAASPDGPCGAGLRHGVG